MADSIWKFKAKVWQWQGDGPASWYFASVPKQMAQDFKELYSGNTRGFGSLKVQATIGTTNWDTSIFPHSESNSYILPLKKSVRQEQDIDVDSKIEIELIVKVDIDE